MYHVFVKILRNFSEQKKKAATSLETQKTPPI